MSWQLLTGVSVITLSVSVLLQRLLMHEDKSDPVAYGIIFQALVGVILFCYAVIVGLHGLDFARYWLPISLTFLLYAAGTVIGAYTLRNVQASIYSILFATNAIWVAAISLPLFHAHVAPLQLLGILLIFASTALLLEYTGRFTFDKGILLGLLTGFIYGLATVAWVYVDKYSDPATWSAISFIGPALVLLLARPSSIRKMKPFLHRNTLIRVAVLGVLYSISALTILLAYKHGDAALIAPLQQTAIITTVVLAIIFLKERNRLWQKIVAALICFIGVLLVV